MRTIFFAFFLFAILTITTAGTRFYRASYREDPSTSIVIGWCDKGISTNAKIHYDVVNKGKDYSKYSLVKDIDRTQETYGMTHRFVRLTGLKPNTIYYFVIHDDEGTSNKMYFKTLPDNPDNGITFITGGDSRSAPTNNEVNRQNRRACDSLVAKIRPDFITFNGDFVLKGTNAFWTDWFTDWEFTLGSDGHIVPIVPVMGNHEASADVYNIFDIPNTFDYYSLGIGGNLIRIYSLNTELEGCDPSQLNWLTNDLKLHTGTAVEPYWKFAQYHVPFVAHANYKPDTILSNCWAPLFQQYNVKLACEAHSHILKVTWPIVQSKKPGNDHGFIRDEKNGTVYIGEGSWGAPQRTLFTFYSPNQAFEWTRNQIKSSGFQLMHVTKQKIEIRTILAVNASKTGQVKLNDPKGTLPTNLPMWNPSNGSVVTLNYNGTLPTNNFKIQKTKK